MPAGHIEDPLALAINSPKPPITGPVALQLTLLLPPDRARSPSASRQLDGSASTRLDLRAPTSRARCGNSVAEARARVPTRCLSPSPHACPGRSISRPASSISGTWPSGPGRRRRAQWHAYSRGLLDFAGTLTMDATISRAVGGVKSIFLKPFDFWFKKNGAGASCPSISAAPGNIRPWA